MDPTRVLAGGLAVSRMAFGASYLARPQSARQNWIGRVAQRPGAQVMIRSQAARDLGLGAGALAALVRGRDGEARTWFAAHALADGSDLAATWLARERLPQRRARFAMGVAAASTAVGALGAARLGRTAPPG